MEAWEQLVEGWSGEVEVAGFSRLVQAAEGVLMEDLADFEIEWISSSLLREPVHLLRLISSHAGDACWSKPLTDAYKIITNFIHKYPQCSDTYHDDIVKACQARVEARVRGAALACVRARAARNVRGVCVRAHLAELEAAAACKAPLAALIGTVCERHPEALADDMPRVWRAYLNLFHSNRNTEAVRAAALRGAGCVLARCGDRLPLGEVALLYPALTTDVGEVSLELLERHAGLFREQLAGDAALRRRLWAAAGAGAGLAAPAARAATAVSVAACAVTPHVAQSIVEREIVPLLSSGVPRVRWAAARVLARVRGRAGAGVQLAALVDVHALEYQLRTDIDDVPDHVAEAVCWCIESDVPHSAVLLHTAILYHERLSAARQRDIVVAGVQAEAGRDYFRFTHSALELVVSESCRAGGVQRYRALWAALCGGAAGEQVARTLARHVAHQLQAHAATLQEQLPAPLEALVAVCACALSGSTHALRVLCAPLRAACARLAALPAAVLALLPLLPDCDDVTHLYQRVEACSAQHAECLFARTGAAGSHAPLPPAELLAAAEMVLSRADSGPAALSAALHCVSHVLHSARGAALSEQRVSRVIRAACRLEARGGGGGRGRGDRHARALRRDLHVFIGKHGAGIAGEHVGSLDRLVGELRDTLTLELATDAPHRCQVSLQRVCKRALVQQHGAALRTLAHLACTHPSMQLDSPPEVLLAVLARVLHAQAVRGEEPVLAPDVPALAQHLIQRICACRESAEGRRALCAAVEPLLRDVTLEEAADSVLHALHTAECTLDVVCALDAAVPVLRALSEDTARACAVLPRVTPRLAVPAPAALEPYRLALRLCHSTRHVFSNSAFDALVDDLIETLLHTRVTMHAHTPVYKAHVHTTVHFLEDVVDEERVTEIVRLCERDGASWQCLYLISILKRSFGVVSRQLAGDWLLAGLKRERESEFHTEVALLAVAEFADVLLKNHYEDTVCVLCDVVSPLSAEWCCGVQGALHACWRAVAMAGAGAGGTVPRTLAAALHTCLHALPLEDIADHLQSFNFTSGHARAAAGACALLRACRVPHSAHLLTRAASLAQHWPRLVLSLYAQARQQVQEHVSYLQDVVWLGVRLGPATLLPRLLAEDLHLTGNAFARDFMPVLYTFLLRAPSVLCAPQLAGCCVLLRDVAECCTQEHAPELLRLADLLWDKYSSSADATSCAALLTSLVRLGASETSRCVSETARRVSDTALPLEERAVLLPALPACDVTTAAYSVFVRCLPARVSECVGAHAHALRAVLLAAAAHAHPALLDLLASLAAGEERRGWWDAAMDSCMASLATTATGETVRAVAARAHHPAALDRLLAPLIRYCSARVCEEYFSAAAARTLGSLRARLAPERALSYRRALLAHAASATLLTLMAEKVPRGSLESPTSVLHSGAAAVAGGVRPWHYVREACKLLVTLQQRAVLPPDASDELRHAVSVFQQRAYCCVCALVCVWRADERLYAHVCGPAWDRLEPEPRAHYRLPLLAMQSRRTLVAAGGGAGAGAGGGAGGSSRPPRVFLSTLSESPYSFDLFAEEEQCERVELVVADSEVNRHPCAAALSALLRHLAAAHPPPPPAAAGHRAADEREAAGPAWLDALCTALSNAQHNVRLLLAQCVVNVRTELRAARVCLSAALLRAVRDTCCDTAPQQLNSLHLAVLDAVWRWHAEGEPAAPAPPAPPVSWCARALARTCVDTRERKGVHYALLGTLSSFLKQFPTVELQWEDFAHYLDSQESGAASACWRVLLRAARAGVHVPHLVPALLDTLDNNAHAHTQTWEACSVFGAAVACVPSASERARAWERYSSIAVRARRDSPAHYVTMLHRAACTHPQHFTHVADTASKVRGVRDKCVDLLAASLRANKHARHLRDHLPVDLRADVMDKCADLLFEEMFECEPSVSPEAKRARTEHVRSSVLATRAHEQTFALALHKLRAAGRWDLLEQKLSEELPTRFVECFYVCVYLPAVHPYPGRGAARGEGGGLPACLRQVVRGLRACPHHLRTYIPAFKVARVDSAYGTTMTCGARAGSLRVATATRTHGSSPTVPVSAPGAALSLDAALDSLLRLGDICWEASESMLVSVWVACGGARDERLAGMLASMVAEALGVARSPHLLRLATDLAPLLADVTPLQASVRALCGAWARCAPPVWRELQLLQDELHVRAAVTHPALQPLGTEPSVEGDDVTTPAAPPHFSIQGLVEAFGALGHCQYTSIRERRRLEASLPPLWTEPRRFRDLLQLYTAEGSDWFASCVRVRRGACHVTRALHRAARAPLQHFHLAAVVETMELLAGHDVTSAPAPDDDSCLVEWAARLQLRASETATSHSAASRSHLAWIRACIARGLPRLALHCIRTCTEDAVLPEREALPWCTARAHALRALAAEEEEGGTRALRGALRVIECGWRLRQVSVPRAVLHAGALRLLLHHQLASLTDDIVEETMATAQHACERDTGGGGGRCERDDMRDLCDSAVLYYDDTWSRRDASSSIMLMCGALRACASETGAAVVLNRLLAGEGRSISHEAADCLLRALLPLTRALPAHFTSRLAQCVPSLPRSATLLHDTDIQHLADHSLDKWRLCLQLLCGAESTLAAHCEALQRALRDRDAGGWRRAFSALRAEVFDNELAGPEYRALHVHKHALYQLEYTGAEMTPASVSQCVATLRSVVEAVRRAAPASRRVSALCPALCACEGEVVRALARILRLPEGHVLGLEEEIPVFRDSVCAPGVLSVRVRAAGALRRRRYLLKRERVSLVACAETCARALSRDHRTLQVIELSEECGLVEYLEGYERVRDLIQEQLHLADIPTERHARRSEELVLAPAHVALDSFARIVRHVPPLAFRRAVVGRCADVEHAGRALAQCAREVARAAVADWLLALGDRHLHNVVVSAGRGALVSLDCGALFHPDPPPARLTALLRLCAPRGWVECALQDAVRQLRARCARTLPLLALALHGAVPDHETELREVSALVRGAALPHEVTSRALLRREPALPHAHHHVQLLQELFAHVPPPPPPAGVYSVHTQVSCLLLQSTSPRLLAVMRSEWEPWL